jgi:hypothetical protein
MKYTAPNGKMVVSDKLESIKEDALVAYLR